MWQVHKNSDTVNALQNAQQTEIKLQDVPFVKRNWIQFLFGFSLSKWLLFMMPDYLHDTENRALLQP